LNRKVDGRFVTLLVVGSGILPVVAATLVLSTPWPFWVLGAAAFLVAYWLIDMATIRLVVAGKPKGIRGFQP
jgi:hypothetical protein